MQVVRRRVGALIWRLALRGERQGTAGVRGQGRGSVVGGRVDGGEVGDGGGGTAVDSG